MKKIIFFVIFIVIIVGLALVIDQGWLMKKEQEKTKENMPVREPAVAGMFYPDNEAELSSVIDEFFSNVELPELDKHIRALIVPHAGYVYSGQVAAYGYKALQGKDIDTVILIGNSHQDYFNGISVYEKGCYKTPLGNVEVNQKLAKKIIDFDKRISFRENTHFQEHSLEVQLPFLQKVLKDFKIVPIIMGNDMPETIDILINALKNLIDDNTLLIASSDLSHYPTYEDAKYSDSKVIEAILTGKGDNLRETILELEKQGISNLQTYACGQGAIEVVMSLMGGKNIKLLKYANSGDVPVGNKSQVVGYASIVFSTNKSENELGTEDQKRLLEIARQSLESYIGENKTMKFEETNSTLNKPMGAFVTLKKHSQLRGCMGVFQPDIPLYQVVAETVISSAINDHRFYPVQKDELDDLEYEISVLSPLKKVNSWQDVEIGKHGVQITKNGRSGVFLPQVATENNWDRNTFLSILCTQKAGLSSDCYKDSDVVIYVFTAQVFEEKDIE